MGWWKYEKNLSFVPVPNHKTRSMKLKITEDWASVILGFFLITLLLSGFQFKAPTFGWESTTDLSSKVLTLQNLRSIATLFFISFFTLLAGAVFMKKNLQPYLSGYPVIFLITIAALITAGNGFLKQWNIESVIVSLALGLALGNLFNLPQWLKDAFSTELMVKIGLIILGTSIIFGDIMKSGGLGLIQALVVVITVWYFAFWLSKKMGIDEEMSLMISSAVSICGVSAAIATAGAIKGDSKKLSYIISIVLISAIPMIIFMPYLAQWMGLSDAVTGAWLGGTIDTTGAVIASGSLAGEEALKISTIVKFSQNVLLGIAAFGISVYWSYKGKNEDNNHFEKPTINQIWDRFPKFVPGFIAASLLFSFFIPESITSSLKNELKTIQNLWFALAFTTIGLETKVSDLFNEGSKKPFYAFTIAQIFNILITLVVAYFLFG
jgi:uncharacterized integral membrane protein (TIGR00698 family)